jgi:hypothetical protein
MRNRIGDLEELERSGENGLGQEGLERSGENGLGQVGLERCGCRPMPPGGEREARYRGLRGGDYREITKDYYRK